jgi:IPT/TIG domain
LINWLSAVPSGANIRVTAKGALLDNTVAPVATLSSSGELLTSTFVSKASNELVFDFLNVPGGTFNLKVSYNTSSVFAYFDQVWRGLVKQPTVTFTSTAVDSSIQGGASVMISGSGFSATNANNIPYVCGAPCNVMSSSFNMIMCDAPKLTTKKTLEQY